MSALFDNKKCVLCQKYVSQRAKYLNTHIAMHVRKGEAHLEYLDGKQFVVITEKAEATSPAQTGLAANTAGAESEPLHNAEVNSAPRI